MYDDLSRENNEKNLIDIGCNHQQIKNFFECYVCGDKKNMHIYYVNKDVNYWMLFINKNRLFRLSCACFKRRRKT